MNQVIKISNDTFKIYLNLKTLELSKSNYSGRFLVTMTRKSYIDVEDPYYSVIEKDSDSPFLKNGMEFDFERLSMSEYFRIIRQLHYDASQMLLEELAA